MLSALQVTVATCCHVHSKIMTTFSVESVIRGHHIYKDIWTPNIGEELICQRELGNLRDPFAVSLLKGTTIVSHVPCKISAICAMFLQTGGTINCTVIRNRQYLRDLVQGGLEVPCELKFIGDDKHIEKADKLIKASLAIKEASTKSNGDDEGNPPEK